MQYVFALLLATLPFVSSAQDASIQNLISNLVILANDYLVPLMLGIAFLIFLINAVRYFILDSDDEDGQENARNLAVYGIAAFVFILSFWGLVNLLIDGVFGGSTAVPCEMNAVSDYIVREDSNAPCSSPRPAPRPGDLGGDGEADPFPIGPQ